MLVCLLSFVCLNVSLGCCWIMIRYVEIGGVNSVVWFLVFLFLLYYWLACRFWCWLFYFVVWVLLVGLVTWFVWF